MSEVLKTPPGRKLRDTILTAAIVLVILLSIPALWPAIPLLIALGCAIGLAVHYVRHKNLGEQPH